MNELSTLNLQDLENLLAKSNCSCHFINPNKTRIILWKEVKDQVTNYYLRIGIQKFISYPLTDKNQEVYWRFNDYHQVTKDPDSITKFHQRQEQAKNYGKSNHSVEPAVNE